MVRQPYFSRYASPTSNNHHKAQALRQSLPSANSSVCFLAPLPYLVLMLIIVVDVLFVVLVLILVIVLVLLVFVLVLVVFVLVLAVFVAVVLVLILIIVLIVEVVESAFSTSSGFLATSRMRL
ncbi:unnamed protein product [Polarella glacialis]|uniref:Uncharacterized protein n=1 Tax=Polarella glacialis TaxID=89957 RepID=A0A813I1F1_POLGL|nr:unnamed protein product [Polarella glacialis]